MSFVPFCILERIDVGETHPLAHPYDRCHTPFSILERIDVGETMLVSACRNAFSPPFSILERIDVGETRRQCGSAPNRPAPFQYPRTDRRG